MTMTTDFRGAIVSAFLLLTLLVYSCRQPQPSRYKEALSPAEEMKHFELDPRFDIELFASEPNVEAPVDMEWDAEGNIYLIEMFDYPYKPEEGKAQGRIRVLQDRNHDGLIDTAIVFADGLPSATSMLPWRGGLIVAAAPDILYLKDTTGDLKADTRQVLFTGFFNNNSEAQITSLRFGIDNWIYANNHGQGGDVYSVTDTSAPHVSMGGSDFRFNLDKGLFEKAAGSGQFGMAMDDWGHRFYTQNELHIQQAPIGWEYLHRHNFLPNDNADVNISDHDPIMFQKTPPPYWRAERTDRRQKEYNELKLDRHEYAEDHFTGSSGATFYGGDAFPAEFYGSVFTGDVAGNLVHRDVLVPGKQNPAFIAQRGDAERDKEFLASTDPWTRPANFSVGPDGYLYMVDMYRQHIETPVSIPEDLKADMQFTNSGYGRIYRITPKGSAKRKTEAPGFRSKTSVELVALLAHPNQWFRLQAHMALLEKQDHSVLPLLKTMFETHTDPRARLQALYVIEGMNALDAQTTAKALKDTEPGIREQAVILSERYPQLLGQLSALVNDSSAQVALQATLSAGQFSQPSVAAILAKSLQLHIDQSLFRTAVLSADAGSSPEFLNLALRQGIFAKDTSAGCRRFLKDISYIIGARNKKADLISFAALMQNPDIKKDSSLQLACIEGLSKGTKTIEDKNKEARAIITELEKNLPLQNEEISEAIKKLKQAAGDTL
ncbi:MAG: PVC-type heme-binding CxxCH protein [Flavitalea sp.]